MSYQRFIIEMGMGYDMQGQDYTVAATQAVENALQSSALTILRNLPNTRSDLKVTLTIGVQDPELVDVAAAKALIPVEDVSVEVKKGGLNAEGFVVAQAAIEAFLPTQG